MKPRFITFEGIDGAGKSSQIAAAVKEISATSQELLSAMEDVSRTANQTADIAEDGRASIVSLDQRMRGLASSSTGISSKLATIRDKAGDINLVVTTITKVADQTDNVTFAAEFGQAARQPGCPGLIGNGQNQGGFKRNRRGHAFAF